MFRLRWELGLLLPGGRWQCQTEPAPARPCREHRAAEPPAFTRKSHCETNACFLSANKIPSLQPLKVTFLTRPCNKTGASKTSLLHTLELSWSQTRGAQGRAVRRIPRARGELLRGFLPTPVQDQLTKQLMPAGSKVLTHGRSSSNFTLL